MIKQIKKIGAASRAFAGSFHVKKRAKKLVTYVGIGTAGTIAGCQTNKLVTQPITDEFLFSGDKIVKQRPAKKIKLAARDTLRLKFDWSGFDGRSKVFFDSINRAKSVNKTDSFEIQRKIVLKIMNDDKNCPPYLDKEKLSAKILLVAKEYGINPIDIACIIKKESHFTENASYAGAKGMMQVTKIPVKDMYQTGRDVLYHEKLRLLKEKYKTDAALYNALQQKDIVNLRVGAMIYLMQLKQTKGNVYNALRRYNGSSKKDSYAASVLKDIKKYKKELNQLEKEYRNNV